MPRYLLDTSIVSAIADDPFGAVAARVTRHGIDRMCTSIIVAAELRFGAAKKGSKRLLHRIETALGNLDVQPFAAPPTSAMPICAPTSNEGTDAIAAHALALDCVLVTGNTREFARIKGLRIEDWSA
jgi:tRNA(fMet)-specific endonuclease VapC